MISSWRQLKQQLQMQEAEDNLVKAIKEYQQARDELVEFIAKHPMIFRLYLRRN